MGPIYARLWETRQWQDAPRGRGAGLAWRPPWGRAGVPVATITFVSSLVCAGWLSVASDMGDGRRRPPGQGEGRMLGSRGSGTVFSREVLKGQLPAWPPQCWPRALGPKVSGKVPPQSGHGFLKCASEFFHSSSLEPQCCLGKDGLSLKALPSIFK